MEKNIAGGVFEKTKLEEGFYLLKFRNEKQETVKVQRNINNNFIQFHFSGKGESRFFFNNGSFKIPLKEENSLLL